MLAEIGLALSVVCAGLWSGLLLTLTTILHPIYAAQDGAGFAAELRRFLPVARKSPTNYLLVIGLVVAPVIALIGGAPPWLTGTGLALTVIGPLLISSRLAEPNYDVILAWDPAALPDDWRAVRRRYFALNWIRAVITWIAFLLFLAAFWSYL
ncbi:hypothetical protein JIG36_09055 [Actinoplanes sp. LDG1-06]|uniref:DUF1772 domain-containing protein n=1 Tax=Paractinoplanes ovalisporus TaxID=2810368 RepID=A0ABS2A791_9ACTN|nr:hypothetical protein [Actinoplanes ovalisporus]MBM2615700.1 hypothetical protein [Actinoplanes ovalisporus]